MIDLREQRFAIKPIVVRQSSITQPIEKRRANRAIEFNPLVDPLSRKIFELLIQIVPTRLGRASWKHLEVMIQIIVRERSDAVGR